MLVYKSAKSSDYQSLFNLEKKVLVKEYDYTFPSVQELIDFLKDKKVFLVYDKDCFIGYFAFNQNSLKEAEIATIIILPEKQGLGYGKQIVDKCISDLSNYKRIKIVTDPRNLAALILYLKKGFIISDFKKDYYRKGLNRVILYKNNE